MSCRESISVMNVLKYVGLERYCEQKREVRITYLEMTEVVDTKEQSYEKIVATGDFVALTPESLIIKTNGEHLVLELNQILDLFLVD